MSGNVKIKKHENTLFDRKDFKFSVFEVINSTAISHWHHHLEVITVKKGTCVIRVNGTDINCVEGDIVLISPKALHSIICSKGVYLAAVIGENLLNDLLFDKDIAKVVKLFFGENIGEYLFFENYLKVYDEVANKVNRFISEYNRKTVGYEMMIKIQICELLLTVYRSLGSVSTYQEHISVTYVKQALKYIEEHYKEKITLKDMGKVASLSEQHFSRLFKQYTDKTFNEYITIYRLESANSYIKNTDVPITQIPEYVGFCNANYFSRVYKKYYGISPQEARRDSYKY